MPPRRRDHAASGPRSRRDHNRRTLSQNFLRGPAAVDRYLAAVDVEPDTLQLEVGAGDGAITVAIAPRCRELRAYEIDPHHAEKLTDRVRDLANVQVVVGDFLAEPPPPEPFAVVGNVPFSITSKVVDWCLDSPALTTVTIITQLEYAKKRTGGYGRWSLRTIETWPWYRWELRGRIPRQEFRPEPSVDAGVLHVEHRDEPLLSRADHPPFCRMVELGFTGVGGSLYRSLVKAHPPGRVAAAFRAAEVDRGTVVAFVTPDQWLAIYRSLR